MSVDLELYPKRKRLPVSPAASPSSTPTPTAPRRSGSRTVAEALGDPIRLQLVDVLRKHAGKVCVCELMPLFDVGQPTVSHHLKKLRDAGLVGSDRPGLWAYYYVKPKHWRN
ncbi:MAG: metalloregulator ArsR/SmtB family transcription factor [Solirubrobacteraceae bacterium]